MLYDIDAFGFVYGYIDKNWTVMSELDLKSDEKLKKEFERTQYDVWKRHNIDELLHEYEKSQKYEANFDSYCRKIYGKKIHS